MKKTAIIAGSFLLAACLTMSTNGLAGNPIPGTIPVVHVDKKFHPQKAPKNFPKLLPDLVATHIEAVPNGHGQCYLKITLKNQGVAAIPDAIYTGRKSAIQVFADGHPSGMVLSAFDTAKKLQRPGGTLKKDWFRNSPLLRGGKDTTIRIIVDSDRAMKEANEANNVLIRSVQCLR